MMYTTFVFSPCVLVDRAVCTCILLGGLEEIRILAVLGTSGGLLCGYLPTFAVFVPFTLTLSIRLFIRDILYIRVEVSPNISNCIGICILFSL